MKKNINAIVVDDDEIVREVFREFLCSEDYRVSDFESSELALPFVARVQPELALVDIQMRGMDGLGLLREIKISSPETKVIMVSGNATMERAIEALRLGATDFMLKPIDLYEFKICLERHFPTKDKERATVEPFVHFSDAMEQTTSLIKVAAESNCKSILVTGETGTGKEVMAHYFHSVRFGDDRPFVAENCPALAESLVESELFGHTKGSFTGATENRKGAFELASGGTLFLDEIGDLPLSMQVKLLRVIETRRVRPVGSEKEIAVDVTIVAATNKNLVEEVRKGTFREDLLFRLNMFTVGIKPLRERREDIIPLANFFLSKYSDGSTAQKRISKACRDELLMYHYPGNARELKNIIERASIMSGAGNIACQHLQFAYPFETHSSAALDAEIAINDDLELEEVVGEVHHLDEGDRQQTSAALEKVGWNRRKAAKILGVSYETLRWKIKKYNLVQA